MKKKIIKITTMLAVILLNLKLVSADDIYTSSSVISSNIPSSDIFNAIVDLCPIILGAFAISGLAYLALRKLDDKPTNTENTNNDKEKNNE